LECRKFVVNNMLSDVALDVAMLKSVINVINTSQKRIKNAINDPVYMNSNPIAFCWKGEDLSIFVEVT
jgi:hypothetical protein